MGGELNVDGIETIFYFFVFIGSSAVSVDWKYPDDSTACIGAKMDVSNVMITYENETAEVPFDNVTTGGNCGTAPTQSSSSLMIYLDNGDRMDLTFSVSGTNTRMDILFTFDPSNYFQNAPTGSTVSMNDEGDTQLSPPDMLYICQAADTKTFVYSEGEVSYRMSLTISNAEIQAFNMNGNFTDEVYECGADDVSTQSSAATSPQAATSEVPSNDTTTEPPAPSNGTTTEPPQSTFVVTTLPPVTTPPPSKASTYTYMEGNKTCVLMKASLQLQVQYETKSNDTTSRTISVPEEKDVTIGGKCSTENDTTSFITISYGASGSNRSLTFNFKVEDGKDMLSSVAYIIDLDSDFPDAKESMVNGTMEVSACSTPNNLFFKCDAQTLGGTPVAIIIRDLKEQAFGIENNNLNHNGYQCENDTGHIPKTAPTGHFEFKDQDQTCIVFEGALTLSLPYIVRNSDGKLENSRVSVAVPQQDQVAVDGSCDTNIPNTQYLELNFYDGWKLKLTFTSDGSSPNLLQEANSGNYYELSNVDVTFVLNNNIFPDVDDPGETNQMTGYITPNTFKTSSRASYTCTKTRTVDLRQFSITTNNMQFQAFMTNSNFTGFGDATECATDDKVNHSWLIVIGSGLGGLDVIIVLIIYRICRTRRRVGYEQMQ